MTVPVGVLGGGGFGQGLAQAAARMGRDVVLWSRRKRDEANGRITVTDDLEALAKAELVFIAVPSEHVASLSADLGKYLDGSHMLVHVSRGVLGEELMTVSQVLRSETPCRRVGALAGPLVAEALAQGTPGGGVVGTRFPEVADAVREAITGPALRIYSTDDVIGVEVASATVGLIALGLGYARGIGTGPATLAVLGTRGMVEASRVGATLGAHERTFGGLAGYGDLLAVMAGDERPEIRLGEALAGGTSLAEAARAAGAHIEGVTIARRVADYAVDRGLEAPIAQTLADVLDDRLTVQDAVERLMTRQVGAE